MKLRIRHTVASTVASAVFAAILPAPASASEFSGAIALADRERVELLLAEHGVEREQARLRAQALTDDEAKSIANQMHALPAGGGGAALGVVLVVYGVYAILAAIAVGVQAGLRHNARYRAP
jgi:hypothetical protein